MKLAKQDMHAAKVELAESQEMQSVSTGDLELTSKDLERDIVSKDALHHECMSAAEEFQETVNTRQKEMEALSAVKKAIDENSAGAATQTYMAQLPDMSFAQLGSRSKSSSSDSGKFQVVHFIRKLGEKTNSAALAQLASRMS